MKRFNSLIAIMFVMSIVLIACSDDKKEESNADNISAEKNNEGSNELGEDSDSADDENSNNDLEITEEDQEDLEMGDTGTVETTIGTFEMTLDGAELVGPELDGVETYEDDLMLLDITIKNVDDETIDIGNLLEGVEVTDNLEGGGNKDGAVDFDSVEELTGELESGDEISGQIITDVTDADTYYVRQDPGSVAAGGTNQVIWTFGKKEIE